MNGLSDAVGAAVETEERPETTIELVRSVAGSVGSMGILTAVAPGSTKVDPT